MTTAYPLAWPPHVPRHTRREKGSFQTSLAGALKNVQESLRKFGADSGKTLNGIVLSSNCALGVNKPDDPGVAVWFVWDGEQLCIPVDRYNTPEANLQAIHHIIEARRVELRHGTLTLVKASFAGFAALPAPDGKKAKTWRDIFHVKPGETIDEARLESLYRKYAAVRHPDRHGGSNDLMSELNVARDAARKELGYA